MDEILVHIGAPATRKNDDLYRSLADAYHEFEPHQPMEPAASAAQDEERGLTFIEQYSFGASFQENAIHGTVDPSASVMSNGSYGSFPSRISPEKTKTSGNFESSPAQASFGSFSSSGDSFVDSGRLAQLEQIQTTWRKNENLRPNFVTRQRGSTVTSTTDNNDTAFIENTQLGAQAVQSQLPDSFSDTSEEDASEDEERHLSQIKNALPPSSLLVGKDVAGRATGAAHASQLSIGASPVGQDISPPVSSRRVFCQDAVLLPLVTTSQRVGIENNNSTQESIDFSKLPCEVLPPAPRVSMDCPGKLPSQLTPYLKALKQQNSRRFQFLRKARVLETDERGYWLVETASWPPKTQFEFWTSLCKQVQAGNFGWGVFLYREPQASGSAESRTACGLGQVRLYCWGEIVEEIWLALWLCSEGKISGSDSRWLDAGDAIILLVP